MDHHNKLGELKMAQKKVSSKSALARELIKEGKLSPKAIAKRTGLSSQTIYTLKWKMANKQGLGAIKPQTSTVGKGTGITSSAPRAAIPLEFEIIDRPKKKSNNRRNAQLKRWAREREARQNTMPIQVGMEVGGLTLTKTGDKYRWQRTDSLPKPTLWQKIKGFFVGA